MLPHRQQSPIKSGEKYTTHTLQRKRGNADKANELPGQFCPHNDFKTKQQRSSVRSGDVSCLAGFLMFPSQASVILNFEKICKPGLRRPKVGFRWQRPSAPTLGRELALVGGATKGQIIQSDLVRRGQDGG